MRAGREDERLRFAGDERGAGEQRVAAVYRIGLVAWLGIARCRQRLAGDGRVVHPHAERLHKTAVRGEDVAGFEQDHIARHELGSGHLPHCARAHDLRRIWEQFLERRQRLLGAIRLPEREHAIDQDYANDREPERRHALPRLAPLGEERERRGDPQNDRKEVHELLGKREQQRLVRDFLHFICPKLLESPLRLGVAQPRESALQAGQGVGDREVVNFHPDSRAVWVIGSNGKEILYKGYERSTSGKKRRWERNPVNLNRDRFVYSCLQNNHSRISDAIAAAYAEGSREAGHEIRCVAVLGGIELSAWDVCHTRPAKLNNGQPSIQLREQPGHLIQIIASIEIAVRFAVPQRSS